MAAASSREVVVVVAGTESSTQQRPQRNKDKMALDLFHLIFLFHYFQHYYTHVAAVESHSQAFIQTDKHLTYIVGDLHHLPLEIKPGESYSELNFHEENNLPNGVRLDPTMLDFGEHPVGMPHLQQVSVHNADTKTSLHLLSISGSTAHFHCSFFQDKMVPPGGNTTFDVVFLARQVGPVENTLYIHTTQGSFKYQVFGVGIPNPYRLRPYLGAKVPLNSSFSSLIEMHNPHSSTLQVVGMFSSAGDLHLELPTGDREAITSLWEIPPYETKPVMRANFIGRVETNHTAFIRIKTNHEHIRGVLILPVEVEVTSAPGIYSPVEMIDFGILRTLDEPQTVQLNLVNTGLRPVHVTGVSLSPPNDAISVEFRPMKLQPDVLRRVAVAQITFRATKALNPRQWSGKIVVKSKHNMNKLSIPYQVNVLHGSLVYNANSTHFYSGSFMRNHTRSLAFTNTFNFSIVIYNVSLPHGIHKYFSIRNFSKPVIIRPQETLVPFLLHFHPNTTSLHFTSQIIIQTNASSFSIPIIVYSGLLKVIHHRPEKSKGQLDFGTTGVGEHRSITFTIQNNNPVNIVIAEFSCSMNQSSLQLLGIEKGNGTTLTKFHNISDIDTDPLILKPYHIAVFSVNVTAALYEGMFSGQVLIVTQFQTLFIPVSLRTAKGSLNAIPEKLIFDRVYPGKIPYKVLQIHSTFEAYMKVTQVSFRPADSRFYYRPASDGQVILEPLKYNRIGRIYFDAKRGCDEECYVGLPTHTPAGHQWLLGLELDREVADTDQYLYTHLQQKWDRVARVDQSTANVTIELDTNQVRGFLFSAQAHLYWPALIRKCKIKFPLTQIGNVSLSDFIVENPGDVPVLIQIFTLPVYPNPQTIVDLMSNRLASDLSDYIETDDRDIFILPDLEHSYSTPNSQLHRYRKHIENTLGIKPHKETITALLSPGTKLKFQVGFRPKDDLSRTSLIIIRNNLTIIDSLVVQGQGGQGEMRFSNRKAGSRTPLLFEMTEKHLKNCDKKKQGKNSLPHFTVKRMFTMRNTGELPFYVHGFSINSSPCEGYGFKVLDCAGFELLPNGSQKIDIAFTPDFTMSRIRRVLTISTSLGPPVNFTLQATVPPYMLARCAAALPRPSWEMGLYYAFICIIVVLTLCVFITAYLEAKRICVADSYRRKLKVLNGTQPYEKGKAFDLKNISGLSSVSKTLPQNSSVVTEGRASRLLPESSTNHTDHTNNKRDKQWTFKANYLFKKLPTIFSIFGYKRKPNILKVNSHEKDTKDLSNNLKAAIYDVKNCSANSSEDFSERSNSGQNNVVRKKTRPGKRCNNDLNSTEFSDKKNVSNTDTNQSRKSNYDTKDFNSSSFETKLNSNGRISSEERRGNTCSVIEEDKPTPVKAEVQTNKNGKNRKKKNKQENKEQNTKSQFTTMKDVTDEKDETSSTTTESSTGDFEEKNCSREASNNSNNFSEVSKSKSKKSKPVEKHSPIIEDIVYADDDFELTTRSKAHKKIKVNPKDTYGGNIWKPNTLALPYNLEPKKSPERKEYTVEVVNKTKKAPRQNKGKARLGYTTSSEDDNASSRSENDYMRKCKDPWDTPARVAPIGDLSDLASQTENFALQHNRSYTSSPIQTALSTPSFYPNTTEISSSPLPSSPASSSVSSRSSSYSSVVSNNNNIDNTNNTHMLIGPSASVQKSNKSCSSPASPVENKWNEFNLFADHGLSGAFTTRCSQPSNYTNSPASPSVYNFSLPSIRENQISSSLIDTSIGSENQAAPQFSLDSFSSNNSMSSTAPNFYNYNLLQSAMTTSCTQAEPEYKVKSENWPNYLMQQTSVPETPWNYSPLSPTMWATSGNLQTSSFETLPSTSTYDPFNPMARIWGPPRSSSSNTNFDWNVPHNHLKD
ncbi:transmembrane protein 131 isoform X2 [Octopus sinensis]|uniref:Transmembrane protein 131 isoform X2 n=1 Tax=Octopus sinensis TaxID=2607531 RepID=A0A6P7UCC9_9MOLL|nr:transmembrane protein 131 isoform X2 [Octopus sinensis]